MIKLGLIAKKRLSSLSGVKQSGGKQKLKPLVYQQKQHRNKHVDVRLFEVFSSTAKVKLKHQSVAYGRKE